MQYLIRLCYLVVTTITQHVFARSPVNSCYTCMSENLPGVTKLIIGESLNIPMFAESSECENIKVTSLLPVQQCTTPCVKLSTTNKYLSFTVRGCSTNLYRDPNATIVNATGCTTNHLSEHDSDGMGETSSTLCLCDGFRCNNAITAFGSTALLNIACFFLLNPLLINW